MKDELLAAMGMVAVVVIVGLAAGCSNRQGEAVQSKFRTPWGEPDLQGVWSSETPTPLERPLAGERIINNDEEAAALEQELANKWQENRGGGADPDNRTGSYNAFWQVRGKPVMGRASLIVDPKDGRLPPLTPQGKAIRAARASNGLSDRADGPEDRNEGERCLHWERMFSGSVNQQHRIVQSPGYVAINSERLHENRVIRLNDHSHLPKDVRQWKGDSIGHWEGATLVVDTANFADAKRDPAGTSKDVHVTERFTRVDDDSINYEATVDDPTIWTQSWTYALPLRRQPGGTVGLFEYACHEGNYGLLGILRGARVQEKNAKGAGEKGKQNSVTN